MQIDENTLTCANFQLSNWNFNYKCSDQGWLVLNLTIIDKVVQNLWHFVHNFRFNDSTRKRFVKLKFNTLVQQLLPNYLGKFNKFN